MNLYLKEHLHQRSHLKYHLKLRQRESDLDDLTNFFDDADKT